jgi:hypothetical protein
MNFPKNNDRNNSHSIYCERAKNWIQRLKDEEFNTAGGKKEIFFPICNAILFSLIMDVQPPVTQGTNSICNLNNN